VKVQGDNSSARDLGAVQRGDAEMEQKMNRALRACLERGQGNPICSIHDQGAGGNGTLKYTRLRPPGATMPRIYFLSHDIENVVLKMSNGMNFNNDRNSNNINITSIFINISIHF
jgi:hypothetical protein